MRINKLRKDQIRDLGCTLGHRIHFKHVVRSQVSIIQLMLISFELPQFQGHSVVHVGSLSHCHGLLRHMNTAVYSVLMVLLLNRTDNVNLSRNTN